MKPRVVGLYTAPRVGAPTEAHDSVEVVAGVGIAGDRYATRLGFWSDPRWLDQELTLIEAETAEALNLEPGRLRRNVVTRDLRLASLIGATFQIGETVLLGVRSCDPCHHLEALTRPGLAQELGARGGLRASVLQGGTITVGDRVVLPATIQA